jgi:hypothetical protein
MPKKDETPIISRTEARAGSSNHVTRYVLPISLILVIITFVILAMNWIR